MRRFRFSDLWTPMVFSPKVMPDPSNAERLDEKLKQAMSKLKRETQSPRTAQNLPRK